MDCLCGYSVNYQANVEPVEQDLDLVAQSDIEQDVLGPSAAD